MVKAKQNHTAEYREQSDWMRCTPEKMYPQSAGKPGEYRLTNEDYVPGHVLIKLEENPAVAYTEQRFVLNEESVSFTEKYGITLMEPVFTFITQSQSSDFMLMNEEEPSALSRWFKATVSFDTKIMELAEALSAEPEVETAEPDYLRRPADLPDETTDPRYDEQWYLDTANIPAAWQYLADNGINPGGSHDVVVAVIDTGVDYTHPDLAANIWVNGAEFNGTPGVDDDGNGYIDDIQGVDVTTNKGDPADDHGHGTHVAGIIAASANNSEGGVGIAFNTQIMPIKAAQYSGVLSASDIAEAVYYAVEKGADIINMSFGGYTRSQIEEDALAIAYSQAVLVAAAGNDGRVNLPGYLGKDLYPGAYNWVLGVMAQSPVPEVNGDNLAGFSNFDYEACDTHEYELMAPGMDIMSTLPGGQYAAWDGTSMATPIVSGVAALLRSKWTDKNTYSSRFIMGQIVSSGPVVQGKTFDDMNKGGQTVVNSYHSLDAYAALITIPEPSVSYVSNSFFDTTDISITNNDDGIIQAGETIDLGITLKNHWGSADNVIATLTTSAGVVGTDPYITIDIDSVDYGAIGSFNSDDNGYIYNEGGLCTGVANPFRFTIAADTPNNHIIPFKLTITATNGMDPGDSTQYSWESSFSLIVHNGVSISGEISEDTTWTPDRLYIIEGITHIPEGVTLAIEPGTVIAFQDGMQLLVRGNLYAIGIPEDRIAFTSNSMSPVNTSWGSIVTWSSANIGLEYCDISYAFCGVDMFGSSSGIETGHTAKISHCRITNCRYGIGLGRAEGEFIITNNILRYCDIGMFPIALIGENLNITGNLFSEIGWDTDWAAALNFDLIDNYGHDISKNTFLHNRLNVNGCGYIDQVISLPDNFWGATDPTVIGQGIRDYYDTFDLAKVIFEPYLMAPSPDGVPAVSSIDINPASPIGIGDTEFTVIFSRDMDISVQPMVAFGPAEPFTDHRISGDWTDNRTWEGNYVINPMTGDGIQTFYVGGAISAVDGMPTINDIYHHFEIITSGTEAMNLQATGAEGKVDLSWTQDDFDLLAGFNLYRSTSISGSYTRINENLIPAQQKTYSDTDVQPGQPYYYKFTVVKTDMTESDFSNVAAATPTDTVPPVVSHNELTHAAVGMPVQVYADVTDNVRVDSVTLYYRAVGGTAYATKEMVHTTGNRYSATLEGSLITAPGLEYYIEAYDGVSIVRSGYADLPHVINVIDAPEVTGVNPNHGPSTGNTAVTVSGTNFKDGASVLFGGSIAGDVDVVSANQITCTTPSHFPGLVDIKVINPDDAEDTLLNAFTYDSEDAYLSLPDISGDNGAVIEIPISAANIDNLLAALLTVQYDSGVLHLREVRNGTLTPGFSLVANTNTPGQIDISMASATTVSGAGTLLVMEFDVTGIPGSATDIGLSNISLNDGAIPVISDDGTFTVKDYLSVSGSVRYYQDSRVVTNTTMTLSGEGYYTDVSDTTGYYSIGDVISGDYTLTPAKTDETDAISAYDASFILRKSVGLISLTSNQMIAADVNRNGSITPMDAAYVLQRSAQLIDLPFPGAGMVWDFVPSSRSYTPLNADLLNQDFTAILIGDVTGNWNDGSGGTTYGENSLSGTACEAGTAELSAERVNTLSGPVTIALNLELNEAELYGADIVLGYDSDVLTVIAVETSELAGGFTTAVNTDQPGEVIIAMAGATPVTSSGELLRVTFNVTGEYGGFSPVEIIRAELNEDGIPAQLYDGRIAVIHTGDADGNTSVNVLDMTRVARIILMLDTETAGADATLDGLVNVLDMTKIARIILGLE
ncbi:MAG: S8 family serine peptidase [Dehalococcoidales bacterium]|nr:S8 family serine peptidase [Dehalococcoidales bacterium]